MPDGSLRPISTVARGVTVLDEARDAKGEILFLVSESLLLGLDDVESPTDETGCRPSSVLCRRTGTGDHFWGSNGECLWMSLGLSSRQAASTEMSAAEAEESWVSLATRFLLLGLSERMEDGEGGRESARGVFD